VVDSGSYDGRTAGEALKIQGNVATVDADEDNPGITGDMVFYVSSTGNRAPTEVMKLAADGNVYITGSIRSTGPVYVTDVTASGNISSSGTVEASSFIGTPVVLEHLSIYATSVNGSDDTDNRVGNTTGLEAGNWTAAVSDRTAPLATDSLYALYLPFKMRNVSAKVAARSQGGGAPVFWMYTGSRVNSNSVFDLGWAASSSCGVVPQSNGTYNMDITGSKAFNTQTTDDVMFVYLSNATAATDTMRCTVVIYGERAE
jgi:hypothetical protein